MADEQVADAPADAGEATSGNEVAWHDSLPEDVRDHPSLSTFTDTGALAKSYVHAQSMIGADKIAIPGKWADENDWNAVYDKLGRPQDAAAYELDTSNAPEGSGVHEDFIGWWREKAHANGLSQQQAQNLVKEYIDFAGAQQGQDTLDVEVALNNTTNELKQEFGAAFEERLEQGNDFIDQFAEDGLTNLILEDGRPLRQHPAFVKTLMNAGNWIRGNISEDRIVRTGETNARTPDEAQTEINTLMRPDSPYWDRRHPSHGDTVEQVKRLMQERYPDMDAPAA